MTDGPHPDAMDSPPCPACERNQNGIFSERYDHQWKCCKCGTIFDAPIRGRLRRYRRDGADHRLHRHLQETTSETGRDALRVEDRAESRERMFTDFEVVEG